MKQLISKKYFPENWTHKKWKMTKKSSISKIDSNLPSLIRLLMNGKHVLHTETFFFIEMENQL